MKNSLIANLIRSVIIVIAICGLLVCAFWYPFSISLSVIGVVDAKPTQMQNIQMWSQIIFYWMVSIPCFVILVLSWLITNSMKKENFISNNNVKMLKICSLILLTDLMVFLIGNVIFLILGWNVYAIVYFMLFAIGIGIVILIKVFEQHLKKVVQMQEDIEGLI